MRVRVKCQHCYQKVSLLPSDDPGAPGVLRDDRGERVCIPGRDPVMHKLMPEVSVPCHDESCGYQEPHRHGFACGPTCRGCGRG